MKETFYGSTSAGVLPTDPRFSAVGTPRELFALLSRLWSAETCAPRMRKDWSPDNKTLGQCSVTAFLAQDIYGGKVLGVPLPDGNFHCFNKVGDTVFDLTDAQFGDTVLCYDHCPEQERTIHFAKEEKYRRYLLLRSTLLDLLAKE